MLPSEHVLTHASQIDSIANAEIQVIPFRIDSIQINPITNPQIHLIPIQL
jgi:hypothetical protein